MQKHLLYFKYYLEQLNKTTPTAQASFKIFPLRKLLNSFELFLHPMDRQDNDKIDKKKAIFCEL
jgi:hypothetical protein